MAAEIQIRRLNDRTIFKILTDAKSAGENELAKQADNLRGSSHSIDFHFSSGLPWSIEDEDLRLAPPGQYSIVSAGLSFSVVSRVGNQNVTTRANFTISRNGGLLTDTFRIHHDNQTGALSSEGEQAVLRVIHKTISAAIQPFAPEDGGLVPSLSNLAEAFSTNYQSIISELSQVVASVSAERVAQISEFKDERKRLQEEVVKERERLKHEHAKTLESEYAALSVEKQKLEEQWGRLEVSSHKDARRRQFQILQDDLQTALQGPTASVNLIITRWAIFVALCGSGVAAGFFAYLSLSAHSTVTDGSTIFGAVRSVLLTFASLASFVGAAAWLRYFYMRDIQAQDDLRRFRNDMARASWVMEAALEIRKEHGETIPPEWIDGVTQGLFTSGKKETFEEGAQALAALMGLSASASFGPDGPKFELSRRGSRAIAAAGRSEQ